MSRFNMESILSRNLTMSTFTPVSSCSSSFMCTILNIEGFSSITHISISLLLFICFLAKEPNKKMGDVEDKVAQSAASFLGTHLEI